MTKSQSKIQRGLQKKSCILNHAFKFDDDNCHDDDDDNCDVDDDVDF